MLTELPLPVKTILLASCLSRCQWPAWSNGNIVASCSSKQAQNKGSERSVGDEKMLMLAGNSLHTIFHRQNSQVASLMEQPRRGFSCKGLKRKKEHKFSFSFLPILWFLLCPLLPPTSRCAQLLFVTKHRLFQCLPLLHSV